MLDKPACLIFRLLLICQTPAKYQQILRRHCCLGVTTAVERSDPGGAARQPNPRKFSREEAKDEPEEAGRS